VGIGEEKGTWRLRGFGSELCLDADDYGGRLRVDAERGDGGSELPTASAVPMRLTVPTSPAGSPHPGHRREGAFTGGAPPDPPPGDGARRWCAAPAR
jgi:hypothetical protein